MTDPWVPTYVMDNCEAMSPEELSLVLEQERGRDHRWTRSMTPKPSPKPPGYKPPMNAVVPLYASDAHRMVASLSCDGIAMTLLTDYFSTFCFLVSLPRVACV
eukprot:521413-Amphidinium_carterae.1